MDSLLRDYRRQDVIVDPAKPGFVVTPVWAPEPSKFTWFEALAVCGLFLLIGMGLQRYDDYEDTVNNRYFAENVKVVKKLDNFRYMMTFTQPPLKPSPLKGTYAIYFCHNYKPCLVEGEVLENLRWRDADDCWDIQPFGLGYRPHIDERGNDIDEQGRIVFDAQKDSCQ